MDRMETYLNAVNGHLVAAQRAAENAVNLWHEDVGALDGYRREIQEHDYPAGGFDLRVMLKEIELTRNTAGSFRKVTQR